MLRSNNVHSAQGNLHPQWGSSSADDGDVMVMEAKATEVSPGSGANQHWSVHVGKHHILSVPPPPPLYMVSSTFCIVSGFIYLFIFYHWHAEHAQGLQLSLPSLQHKDFTSYFDSCSGKTGCIPSSGRSEKYPEWEGTARNCLRK